MNIENDQPSLCCSESYGKYVHTPEVSIFTGITEPFVHQSAIHAGITLIIL